MTTSIHIWYTVNHTIQGIDFQWNAGKAANNQIKHAISFETACAAFFDPFLISLDDDIIDGEVRHTAVGMTTNWQILYVVFVWRGDVIRLISARLATSRERMLYEDR